MNSASAAESQAHAEACRRVAARFPSRWLRSYVASKLESDPAFPAAFAIFRSQPHAILDVGCGVGLLPFYLRERGLTHPISGVDTDERKINRAIAVADAAYRDVDFARDDIRSRQLSFSGSVAVFDVLHYLRPRDQANLLARVAESVTIGGVLLIRDCPQARSCRYLLTVLAEKFAQAIQWNVATGLHFPTRESIEAAFAPAEFEGESRPLWGRTPFNNHLFVFKRKA